MLEAGARNALQTCLALTKDEKALIITDAHKVDLAEIFFNVAKQLTNTATLLEVPIPQVSGQEPNKETADAMLSADVICLMASKSFSHTKARRAACENGARIASMSGLTEDMLRRTMNVDYWLIRERTQALAEKIRGSKTIRITTPKGTDLIFSIAGRELHGLSGGIFDEPGKWGNLPEGELCFAPVEGSAKGVYIVDASHGGIGKVEQLRILVEKGFAMGFEGNGAKELEEALKPFGKAGRNIAELGIGTHHTAQITGITLEDEKVLGTCHVALGNNVSFGGNVDVGVHLDGVIRQPTIYADDRPIMIDGKII